jgi:mycothiol synthase
MHVETFPPDMDAEAFRASLSTAGLWSTLEEFAASFSDEPIRRALRFVSGDLVLAFAILDYHNTIWFRLQPDQDADLLTAAVVNWADTYLLGHVQPGETDPALNSCTRSSNIGRIRLLEENGFVRLSPNVWNYSRSLMEPIEPYPLPEGFTCRQAAGESEAGALVVLQRAALGTENITLDSRLDMMRLPNYAGDVVITDPSGRLAAFCFCTVEEDGKSKIGRIEPIGTLPEYRQKGLAKAALSEALVMLHEKGCQTARLSTSPENLAMQQLAESLGFTRSDDIVWYTKFQSPSVNSG